MNTKQLLAKVSFASLSLLCLFSSCGVDERYDTSKELDKTIGLGKGLSLPIGSTEKILLSDLLDAESTDVLEVDESGNYSITANGSFTPEAFKVDEVEIALDATSSETHYDFKLNNIFENTDDISTLPWEMQQQIMNNKYPYTVHNEVENSLEFDINQTVPEEMLTLAKMDFKEPVKMVLSLIIQSENWESNELLIATEKLYLKSEEYSGFVVEVPTFIVFDEREKVKDGRLILEGVAKYSADKRALVYSRTYDVVGLDFTGMPAGFLPVKDGKIRVAEDLFAYGYLESDVVYFDYADKNTIASVNVLCEMAFDDMPIKNVEGKFNPNISPVVELIDLDFGSDMDFFKNAYIDVQDPCVYLTFVNPIEADINAKTCFIGLDDDGNVYEGAHLDAELSFEGNKTNKILVDMYNRQLYGYTNCVVENLDNLLKHFPSAVEIDLNTNIDTTKNSTIELGSDLQFYGEYEVAIPLAFDSLRLEYTHTINEVLGGNFNDITDVDGITLSFDVYNTLPVGFVPEIIAYDAEHNEIEDVKLVIDGEIKKGQGAVDGEVATPVKSSVKVTIEAHNAHLKDLDKIEIKLAGIGAGVFNANEYLQLKDIHLNIDGYITMDLND
ncbi:MAG: hypothetical protein J6P97_05350 [Bacteroidales bacterium]|nr:hypothetical protein [Bacteroidales bacterium]